jgi:molecular chaperone DnaJ
MQRNYYVILGVSSSATPDQIKAAFRRRAMELHPDHSRTDSAPFQELQEAYGVLSDPERRRRYDEHGSTSVRRAPRGPSRPPAEPLVPRRRAEPFSDFAAPRVRDVSIMNSFSRFHPSFDELFDRLRRNFEDFARPKAERMESLTVEVVLSPNEALSGGVVRVRVPGRATCASCGGRGAMGPYECWQCEGEGAVAVEYPVRVEFPPAVRDGYVVSVRLDEFGITNFHLTIVFRVGSETFKES